MVKTNFLKIRCIEMYTGSLGKCEHTYFTLTNKLLFVYRNLNRSHQQNSQHLFWMVIFTSTVTKCLKCCSNGHVYIATCIHISFKCYMYESIVHIKLFKVCVIFNLIYVYTCLWIHSLQYTTCEFHRTCPLLLQIHTVTWDWYLVWTTQKSEHRTWCKTFAFFLCFQYA
jgi:hypothetical protein